MKTNSRKFRIFIHANQRMIIFNYCAYTSDLPLPHIISKFTLVSHVPNVIYPFKVNTQF